MTTFDDLCQSLDFSLVPILRLDPAGGTPAIVLTCHPITYRGNLIVGALYSVRDALLAGQTDANPSAQTQTLSYQATQYAPA